VDVFGPVFLAVWSFAAAFLGGLVGLVLGNLRLPVVMLLASSPAAGGGANIAISGVVALTASLAHMRAGRVNWRLVAWMAPPSAVGALVGGALAGRAPERLLFGLVGAVLVLSGLDLLRGRRPPPEPSSGSGERRLDLRAAVLSGLVVGLIGGLVGLILSTLRMPALLRLVGEAPARAVGTNLVVGVVVGVAGLVGHLPAAAPDARLVLLGAAASIPGAWLGARFTGRLSEAQLVRAIGLVLTVAGVASAARAFYP
jgi:uncharacterized membrane protein YfcA